MIIAFILAFPIIVPIFMVYYDSWQEFKQGIQDIIN